MLCQELYLEYGFRKLNPFFKGDYMYRLFSKDEELKKHIKEESQSFKRELGVGGEGISYLGYNGKVYKMFYSATREDYRRIITTSEVDLEHFCFPEQMYIIRNRLAGYRTKYVKGDIMLNLESLLMGDNPGELDMITLCRAYDEILADIEELSKKQILMYDLAGNLIYDGNSFYAIDTCDYRYATNYTEQEILESNIRMLDDAVQSELEFYYEGLGLVAPYFRDVYREYKSGRKKKF